MIVCNHFALVGCLSFVRDINSSLVAYARMVFSLPERALIITLRLG